MDNLEGCRTSDGVSQAGEEKGGNSWFFSTLSDELVSIQKGCGDIRE